MALCPCCSQKAYSECCEPFLNGESAPATPEQLMRSRYCAFVKKDVSYLVNTLCPSQRREDDAQTLTSTMTNTRWHGLRVLHSSQSTTAEGLKQGEVEFVAFYSAVQSSMSSTAINLEQLHEHSHFVFDERWFYTTGTHFPKLKLQRNEPCFCGSGKKLKKCCSSLIA